MGMLVDIADECNKGWLSQSVGYSVQEARRRMQLKEGVALFFTSAWNKDYNDCHHDHHLNVSGDGDGMDDGQSEFGSIAPSENQGENGTGLGGRILSFLKKKFQLVNNDDSYSTVSDHTGDGEIIGNYRVGYAMTMRH